MIVTVGITMHTVMTVHTIPKFLKCSNSFQRANKNTYIILNNNAIKFAHMNGHWKVYDTTLGQFCYNDFFLSSE